MKKETRRFVAVCVALGMTVVSFAVQPQANIPAIALGAPFCDHAVLQRDMPVPVWGWSTSDAQVSVDFGGQKKSATADKK